VTDTLKVSYPVLEASADIRREFSGLDDAMQDVKDAVGSRHLADALEEFANNWDRHRGALVESLGSLEEATRSAIATWQAADQQVGATIDAGPAPG